jgi:hypothetical protein
MFGEEALPGPSTNSVCHSVFDGRKAESFGGIWRDCGGILSKRGSLGVGAAKPTACQTLEECLKKSKCEVVFNMALFLQSLLLRKETNSFLLKN